MSGYPERAQAHHFPAGSDPFDIGWRYKLEYGWVKNHLEETAEEAVRTGDRERALGRWAGLKHDIVTHYLQLAMHVDQRIYDAASNGALQRECPSKGAALSMRIALVVALVAEATVMVAQQVLAPDFNPFIVVLAALLGAGGFLQGKGLGRMLVEKWRRGTQRTQRHEEELQHWLMLGVGSALVLLVVAVRSLGATDTVQFVVVASVTLLLGGAVATCEALAVLYGEKREEILLEMALAQQWAAVNGHDQALKRGEYEVHYMQAIERCVRDGVDGLVRGARSATVDARS